MEFIENLNTKEDWDSGLEDVSQTKEFADSQEGEGQLYFCHKEKNKAIIIIKKKILNIFSRAQIFTNSVNKEFLKEIFNDLKKKGIPYARIGNTMFGFKNELKFPGSNLIERNTFIINLSKSEDDIWNNFNKKLRNSIRKAEKENVKIEEIKEEGNLKEYYELSLKTEKRIKEIKGRKTFAIQKYEFFKKVFNENIGRFLVARYNGKIIAGALFLVWADKTIYFQSFSSVEHTPKQAPSLLQWEAIKKFKKEGLKKYDLGGVTINLEPSDSRYWVYEFKRKFNGELQKFYNLEVILSPFKKKIQDKVASIIYGNIKYTS